MRNVAVVLEEDCIIWWAELHVLALAAMYIPGIENWQTDYLSLQTLGGGGGVVRFLQPDVFRGIPLHRGTPGVDLLVPHLDRVLRCV